MTELSVTNVTTRLTSSLNGVRPETCALIERVVSTDLIRLINLGSIESSDDRVTNVNEDARLIRCRLRNIVADHRTLRDLRRILAPLQMRPYHASSSILTTDDLSTLFTDGLNLTVCTRQVNFPIFLTESILITLRRVIYTRVGRNSVRFLRHLDRITYYHVIRRINRIRVTLHLVRINVNDTIGSGLSVVFLRLFTSDIRIDGVRFLVTFDRVNRSGLIVTIFNTGLRFVTRLAVDTYGWCVRVLV